MKLKTDRFGKVLAIGTLAIGAVTALSAAPAGAVTFTGGELDFGLNTTSFANSVNLVPGNTVNLTFNPGGSANIISATGSFVPSFPSSGNIGVIPSNASLSYVSGTTYSLNSPLVFAFANGVSYTVNQNSTFTATQANSSSTSFSLLNDTGSFFTSGADITPVPTFALTLTDTGLPSGGLYVAQVSPTAVPEPFTVIGTLIGGTAVFRLRKKMLASAEK